MHAACLVEIVLHAIMHHDESVHKTPYNRHQSLASCVLNATFCGWHVSNSICIMLQETPKNLSHVLQHTTDE